MRRLSLLFGVFMFVVILGCGKKESAQDQGESQQSSERVSRAVRTLEQQDLDVSAKDLLLAAARGSRESVESLLSAGLDINVRDENGNTPLHLAAAAGQMGVVELLIQKGADLRATNTVGRMPHQEAVDTQNGEIVAYFYRCGAPVMIQEMAHAGAAEPFAQILDSSPEAIAAFNSRGGTLLHTAAEAGDRGIVELLIFKNVDMNARDRDFGHTALMSAIRTGHLDLASYLVQQGADIDIRSHSGATALIFASADGHEALVRQLLAKGAEINAIDSNGDTALHWAAQAGHSDVVRMLVNGGAQLELKNQWGKTALDVAKESRQDVVAQMLLSVLAGTPLPEESQELEPPAPLSQVDEVAIEEEVSIEWLESSTEELVIARGQVEKDFRMMQTGLAAYLVDYDKYPSDLNQLTTPIAYLPWVPKDAFLAFGGKRENYGYVTDGTGHYILRSVGADMKADPELEFLLIEIDTYGKDGINRGPWIYDPTNGIVSSGDVILVGP